MQQTPQALRIFLESPRSIEPFSEGPEDIKRRCPIPKRRRRPRRETLPPYIPYRSVYERKDFQNLTERQRLMALKYQTSDQPPSALFLSVHDIHGPPHSLASPAECPLQDGPRGELPLALSVLARDAQAPSAETPLLNGVPGERPFPSLQSALSIVRLPRPAGAFVLRLPFRPALTCTACSLDAIDLLRFLSWHQLHALPCRHSPSLAELKRQLVRLIGSLGCLCDIEESYFTEAASLCNCACQ